MVTKAKSSAINQTKIIATIGPACNATSLLQGMIGAGMDAARINFSHGNTETNLALLHKVRQAAKLAKKNVAIIQDLQGSKLRVGELPLGGLRLLEGSVAILQAGLAFADDGTIPIPYNQLAKDLRRRDKILINDGMIELEVLTIQGRKIMAKVIVDGTVLSSHGLSVPTRQLSIESITEKDEVDISIGLENNVDFIALSYVRTPEDIHLLKNKISKLLPRDVEPPKVIVKVEKLEALKNLSAIIHESDAIMVARGDLGLDASFSQVPLIQKDIIARCLIAAKPVIVATQMLSSMASKPRPTRAEASDVANAVIDHTDAVMLSDETAMGRYPIRTVQTMAEIIAATEASPLNDLVVDEQSMNEPAHLAVAAGATRLASQITAKALLVTTQSGFSARAMARFRPEIPIYAATNSPRVQRQLNLSWGVIPLPVVSQQKPEEMVDSAVAILKKTFGMKRGDMIVVVSGLKKNSRKYESIVRVMEI